MSLDNDLKELLSIIDNEQFDAVSILPHLERSKVEKLIKQAEQEEFINHSSRKGQPLLLHFMNGDFDLHPSTFITRKGYKFLEGEAEPPVIGQQVNISGNVKGSNIGNHGAVTNHYGFSINDFKTLFDEINDPQDKKEAGELIQIIEKESITPGRLQKFDSFLKKYPNIANATGKFLLSIATGTVIGGHGT